MWPFNCRRWQRSKDGKARVWGSKYSRHGQNFASISNWFPCACQEVHLYSFGLFVASLVRKSKTIASKDSSQWTRRVDQLEANLADLRNAILTVQIRFNRLSAHLLTVQEESISQRKSIRQLQDECDALRKQLEEFQACPQQNDNSRISQEASSPPTAPIQIDLNAPTPGNV